MFILWCITLWPGFLAAQTPQNSPENNFEQLWKDFDEYYGQFKVKGVDWDSIYNIYKPMVTNDMTDRDFYNLIISMLTPLNDPHVTLYPTTPELPRWSIDLDSGTKVIKDFSYDLVKRKYITKWIRNDGPVQYGIIDKNLGYVHYDNFEIGLKRLRNIMNNVVKELKDTNGIIIDIRDNPGGRDP